MAAGAGRSGSVRGVLSAGLFPSSLVSIGRIFISYIQSDGSYPALITVIR